MLTSHITEQHKHHQHDDNCKESGCCSENNSLIPANCPLIDLSGRKRVSKACLECKKRHCRCDHQRPCGRCAKLGLECVDAPTCKRGPAKGTSYKKRKRVEESSSCDSAANQGKKSTDAESLPSAEVKLHENKNKKRRITPDVSQSSPVTSNDQVYVQQVKQEQLLHNLFNNIDSQVPSHHHQQQQPSYASTISQHLHPSSMLGFHPYMLPSAADFLSYQINMLQQQSSLMYQSSPHMLSSQLYMHQQQQQQPIVQPPQPIHPAHLLPQQPSFPLIKQEETEASNDCCSTDCDSGCDSNDAPSTSSTDVDAVLADLPDIEDLSVGMCMNTACGANFNRSCLFSELDLLDDNEEDILPPLSSSSSSFAVVKSEAPYMPHSTTVDEVPRFEDAVFELDLGLSTTAASSLPRTLSLSQIDDFLLS